MQIIKEYAFGIAMWVAYGSTKGRPPKKNKKKMKKKGKKK
jgi:hypothetical protein